MICCAIALLELINASSEDLDSEDQLNDEDHQQQDQQQDQYRQPEQQLEESWDYEPRVWVPEETSGDSYEELSAELSQENKIISSQFEPSESIDDSKDRNGEYHFREDSKNQHQVNSTLKATLLVAAKAVRDRSYFWDSKQRRHYGKIDVSTRQSEADKCTQFRVDIRETVICDKKRCDKLDFEWPKYDNQIVVIESTKFGMRFHRSEHAFSSSATIKSSAIKTKELVPSNRTKKLPPIKFDLFDLFKPKPTSTAMPITEATSKATTKPEEETTTQSSDEQPASPPPPPPAPDTKDTTIADTESQDKNQTQLVTTFRLNTKRRMQKIIGFGGALSDSTCRNIKSLSPNMAKSLMEDYFGNRGLRYTIARMTIGSSDFSTTPYTNNDRPVVASEEDLVGLDGGEDFFDEQNQKRQHEQKKQKRDGVQGHSKRVLDDNDDVEMTKFHLTDEDYDFKLPIARQAMATSQQGIKFFSSLWSPPIWMKNNSNIVHGYLKGDIYGPYYKGLAELIIKWLEAYRKQGIEFWATTGLNEPVTGIKPFIFHNSLGITREDYVTFIKLYLGPMLRQRGFQNVKLIALDDNKAYAPGLAKAALDDRDAAKYISGIGVHWYMSDEYENLNFLGRDYPDKFILSTEASNGYLPFQVHTLPGDWDRGVAYMYDIIKLMHKNVAGWVDWNMALNLNGGPSWAKNNLDAPVIVNAERDEYYKSPMFYAIGHFSRFVEPNSTRLDQRLAYAKYDYPLEATAFHTPKDFIVIVALNANKHRVPFKIIVDKQLIRVVNLKEESFSTIVFKWKNKSI